MKSYQFFWPLVGFVVGAGLMTGLYFGIVSLAQGGDHAAAFFLDELAYLLPLILGFGIQTALYLVLKKQLHLPPGQMGASGAMTGAGGSTSTIAMVACCAHHVTDVLPILGISAAATLLTEYQNAFMLIGLLTTMGGIVVMIRILVMEQNRALAQSRDVGQARSTQRVWRTPVGWGAALIGFVAVSPWIVDALLPRQVSGSTAAEIPPQIEAYPITLDPLQSNLSLWFAGETVIDQQGAVVVEVTPLHMNEKNSTLYFGVAMNTHSVDLSMDLASLSQLRLADGTEIEADDWDSPAGGHHVSDILSFILSSQEYEALIETDAIQLSVFGVDVEERVFLWQKAD